MREVFVYIAASPSRTLYVGVTSDLERRMYEHKRKLIPGFTSRYGVSRLVHSETFANVDDAIAREKEIKGWRREKKVRLIEMTNPRWRDLSQDWYDEGDAIGKNEAAIGG